ncbi:MAG: SEC-C metal-binding domain-containing protein [Actinomycetota bacterium]|nr:SEC-C metal-binding domain-containing protein [Actinomycetota bacterium]
MRPGRGAETAPLARGGGRESWCRPRGTRRARARRADRRAQRPGPPAGARAGDASARGARRAPAAGPAGPGPGGLDTRLDYVLGADAGLGLAWPPAKNAACWCGSGSKYKRCRGR